MQLHRGILPILARMSKQLFEKNVCGSFVLWLPLQEVYKYEIHASSFHIFSGTTKTLNCNIYGNNLFKSSTISLGRKNRNHIRNRRVILNWA